MTASGEVFVGIDTAKVRNAVAVAVDGRERELRYLGEFDNTPDAVARLIRKLAGHYETLHVCCEAGPTGYGLYCQILALGRDCVVVAPSLIPSRPGKRVKTNRRDALSSARLLRAGELTAVWVPDEVHEAMRDLTRTRSMEVEDYPSTSPPSCSGMDAATKARRVGAADTSVGSMGRTLPTRRNGRHFTKC